jgi:Cytochrome c oxidase subunit IV
MRVNTRLFLILAAFFWAADALYILWNLIDSKGTHLDWVGTIGIGLSGILAAFLSFFLGATQRGLGGTLPEDRQDAEIDDGDPEIGYFSPWSWWPMFLALGLALMFLGLAVGIWLMFLGAPIVILAVVGWYYEYYRGNFAR